jgi:hypothetical protein
VRYGLVEYSLVVRSYGLVMGRLRRHQDRRAVARQLGVSRSWASREANAPDTRHLLPELLEIGPLDVVEDAMKARLFSVVNRVLVDVGPDHFAQLEAVKMFTELMASRKQGDAGVAASPNQPMAAPGRGGRATRRGWSRAPVPFEHGAVILWINGCVEFQKSIVAKRPTTLHARRVGANSPRAAHCHTRRALP